MRALGLSTPAALALAAGRIADGEGGFNLAAGVTVGVVSVGALTLLLNRTVPDEARTVPDEAPVELAPQPGEPAAGDRVEVRTHFTAAGGYVAHGPLLCWATAPSGQHEAYTPGTACVVAAAGGDVLGVEREAA
ncbi:hypothetical protein GCM10010170_035960 [Dactylosporangium salmoneum]|uniref:Uncharacterized protein n=2 Tax=Dactylosporangium salmoneum TaxID=53361 RepID=A0ABP5T932_9ACTN